jgi:hypothetical protein
VLFGVPAVGEAARGLDDDLGADRLPGDQRRVFLGEDDELVFADLDALLGRGNLLFEVAEDRVVLQQVRERLGVRDVVDGHEVYVGVAHARAEHVAPDAPEPINSNFYRHPL